MPSDEENDTIGTQELSSRGDESHERHVDAPKDLTAGTNLGGAQNSQTYKPHQRNPLYSGAENSCLWELNRLSRHYHPSVCLFARTLMKVSFSLGTVLDHAYTGPVPKGPVPKIGPDRPSVYTRPFWNRGPERIQDRTCYFAGPVLDPYRTVFGTVHANRSRYGSPVRFGSVRNGSGPSRVNEG